MWFIYEPITYITLVVIITNNNNKTIIYLCNNNTYNNNCFKSTSYDIYYNLLKRKSLKLNARFT